MVKCSSGLGVFAVVICGVTGGAARIDRAGWSVACGGRFGLATFGLATWRVVIVRAIKSILVQWIAFVLGAFVLAGPAVPGARIQVGRSPHSAAHPEFRELEISAASTSSTSISSTALPGWHWPTGSSDFCGYLGWLSYNPRYSGYHLAQDMCNPQGGSVHSIGRGEVVLSSTNVSGYGPGDGPGGAL